MSKMITLAPIFAVICLVSAAPYQPEGDAYHQAVDYQGQVELQQHVNDIQQHLQQNHAQEFQGHQHQQVQTFHPQGFQQGHLDVNSGIGHGQVHNTQGDAKILSYQLDTDEHSNYQYAYETDNGIRAQEIGSNTGDGIKMQGAYSYTGDDGQVYTVTYTADENGFHPSGAHLPTPPPIPEAIARSIEKNQRDEANGIHDDGQYNPQQSEQYTQQSEQKPQISAAPKKYRPKVQMKEVKQQRPIEVQHQQITLQQPQQQIFVQQPRHQIKPYQVQNQIVQQTQQIIQKTPHKVVLQPQNQIIQQTHQIVQQTPQKVVLQPQLQTARRPQHTSLNSQQHLQLQALKPAKYVVRQNPRHQQQAAASHQQIPQASLHQQNVDQQVHLQSGFVPKYEVKENQYDLQEPEVQKQHIIEYHLPASQNTLTEERHKVEYIVPSMKQFLEQYKPDKERQVLYQVPIPTYQHKPAQDYIGPAPIVDYQRYQQ